MPYRKQLKASASEGSQKILQIWKQERGYRVGKAVFLAGLALSFIATLADVAWSATAVWVTDLILLFGCAISLYWVQAPKRPIYYWWPAYFGLWISILPSLWTTGGLYSPFLGIDIALLYAFGAVMETKRSSWIYFLLALSLIPALYLFELYSPLSMNAPPPPALTSIIIAATFAGLFIFINSMLRTESELSLEFTEHYRNLTLTEAELSKSESLLREAQEVGGIGSWEWDVEQDRVTWSDELFKIFELSKETFKPSFQGYVERLHPTMKDEITKTIETSNITGKDFSFENKIETSKGDRYILSRGRVIKDNDGSTKKMLGTCQDITDRKLIESELLTARNELEERVKERTRQLAESLEREKAAKELAEHASQAKMQFLANMSHEIRTPMNSILGFSDLLYAGHLSPEQTREYVSRIRANGTRLLHLIDDILDLSKFEAGEIPLHKTTFSLKALLNDIVSSFQPPLKSKGVELVILFHDRLPDLVTTDAHRLSQIFNNLIGNAVKFTEKGEIKISFSTEPLRDHRVQLVVHFEDTGIGIPKENQSQLFKPFSQGDNSVSRRFGGTGLGLVLSKRIAEALEGDLNLEESVEGRGSRFKLQIPVEIGPNDSIEDFEKDPALSAEEFYSLKDKKILLAEDSHDNAVLIRHYLKPLGLRVDIAEDGLKATTMALREAYDCILMDIQMPGMDGLEATRKIRSQGYEKPIIALTAHALPAEIERSLAAGCDLHLTKPIAKAELTETLSKYLDS